jgi:hypothetical protein
MVPEMPATTVRTDGGRRVTGEGLEASSDESEAPLVPDLS